MSAIRLSVACLTLLPCMLRASHGAPPRTLDAGPLKLEIHLAPRTATLFHVVDQLAEWSEFCHRQYVRYFEGIEGGFSKQDRALLAKHAAVRRQRGWGEGLEQTFYTPEDLEAALKRGVQSAVLTEEQASVEREVLTYFAPRIEALTKDKAPEVEAFADRLAAQQASLRELAEKASRFCEVPQVTVPVYLLPNPSAQQSGGGYNGDRLTMEVPGTYGTFLHKVFHAFLKTRRADLEKAVRHVPGLDTMTLKEGMAYALWPGILRSETSEDQLAMHVRNDLAAKKPLLDNYTRFHRLGLALRPLLREALDDERQTLTTFLPRAVDAWRVAAELDLASAGNDREHKQITLSKAYWFDDWFLSQGSPDWASREKIPADRGLLLVHAEEWFDGSSYSQYSKFLEAVDKNFLLKAPGHPDVKGAATGSRTNPSEGIREFSVVIEPKEYEKIVVGVPYTIHAVNSRPAYQWKVKDGLSITRHSSGDVPPEVLQKTSRPRADAEESRPGTSASADRSR